MKFKFDFLTKCLLLLLVATGMSSLALAQRTIRGTVTDAGTGDPLIGANILAVGTSTGTITDIDGSYSLQVPVGITEIEVSYTGYNTNRVSLGASNVVDVALSAGSVLDEVVVVGYGTAKKSDLTGSMVSVGEDDFNKGLVTAPDQLIQGKAAGVQVLNNSGQPGGSTTVRIRGNASIRGGNDPLFVLDGVPLNGSSSKPGLSAGDIGSTNSSNPLNWLNPNDIESMQILKDASATAIYGSRGANGVIIITTKKGKSGEPSVNVNMSVGASNVLKKYDVLDAAGYRKALSAYGLTSGDYGKNVDAFDEITRTGITQNHSIGIGGGSTNGNYRVSLSYLNQEGIIKNNDLERMSANLSGNYKFLESKRLGLDYIVIASRTTENGPAISTNAGFRGSLIGNALQWNPTSALYNSNGTPVVTPEFGEFTNPVALLDAYHDNVKTTDLFASVSPSYEILDGLTYKFLYSINSGVGSRNARIESWINIQGVQGQGVGYFSEKSAYTQVLQHTLNYSKSLTSDISLNAVAGYEYQKIDITGKNISASGFQIERFDYTNIFQASPRGVRDISSNAGPIEELQSIFGRVMLNLSDKYLLTATVRRDGSSKFGVNNQYGTFPSVAAAWNLHNESFLAGGAFDMLKLRVGWGQTGNQDFDSGASQERFFLYEQGAGLSNVANPDLKWETTTTYNVGLDFAVLDYKLSGTLEYFNKSSEDLLFQFPTIQPAPAAFYWINLPGTVENKGVEVTLNAELVNNDNLRWDLGVNAAFVSNELKNYTGPVLDYATLFGQGISNAPSQRLQNGQPLNAFYLKEFTGIDEAGQSTYANNGALAFVGDPNPSVILGISSGVTMGALSLGLNFNGAMGHDIYNNTKNTVIPIGNLGSRNVDASLIGGTPQESISNPVAGSSRYLEDGSYLKLANATLAYNLGNLNNSIRNARIYLSGTNLLVFTGYSGFDPEVNTVNFSSNGLPSSGIEYIPYPSARTITLGLNFSF
ncbi:MAG: SusC/RagA family TonB-linked outer membrane protein [Saprospiraceae bacterium]|nr:MAG: SusC/RagA family TonB-linked outer membrane protein [Saprospiraceae bacterium]